MDNRFVLFEGVDGTGKSTVANAVSKDLGFHYLSSPPDVLKRFRSIFDGASPEISSMFYLVGNVMMNGIVERRLHISSIVLDRHFPSTVAYHSARGCPDLGRHMNLMNPRPDKIFYLYGNPEDLIDRAGVVDGSDSRGRGIEFMKRYAEEFENIFSGMSEVVRIDTTRMCQEEVIDSVLKDLRN